MTDNDMNRAISEKLATLIEKARSYVMTQSDFYEQRISFAYGNLAIEDDSVTRESVERIAEELYGKPIASENER